MSRAKQDSKLDAFIRDAGGEIHYKEGGRVKEVDFPGRDMDAEVADVLASAHAKIAAAEEADQQAYEAACKRAEEYGTVAIPLLRPRGDGWFACSSHSNPGFWRVCQLDMEGGQPTYCDCPYFNEGHGTWCHHAASAHLLAGDLWRDGLIAPDYTELLERSIAATKKELCHA